MLTESTSRSVKIDTPGLDLKDLAAEMAEMEDESARAFMEEAIKPEASSFSVIMAYQGR